MYESHSEDKDKKINPIFEEKSGGLKKIVIASDSFKGSLTSAEVAEAVSAALRACFPEAAIVPLAVADGGEGTMETLTTALGGVKVPVRVTGPLGDPVNAWWGRAGETAIVETAAASGLTLLPKEERNPLYTTTFGTGELLRAALEAGCRKLIVGLGGSATNDGGTGLLQALGVRFLDAAGQPLRGRGCDLLRIARIDASGLLPAARAAEFLSVTDVDTPFADAALVFGPQKGASPSDVRSLTAGLRHLESFFPAGVGAQPGTGAAGGLGGALAAFLGARLRSGIETVLEALDFDHLIQGADLVITGEGRADDQTPHGKTAAGVLAHARAAGIPVLLVAGLVRPSPALEAMGFQALLQTTPPGQPPAVSMQPATARENIVRTLQLYFQNLRK